MLTIELKLTELEADNLLRAVAQGDNSNYRDSLMSDARKMVQAKVMAAIGIARQERGGAGS